MKNWACLLLMVMGFAGVLSHTKNDKRAVEPDDFSKKQASPPSRSLSKRCKRSKRCYPINTPCTPNNPCRNGGRCENIVNSASVYEDFRCICPAGYKGKKCSIRIRPCDSSPCKNGGTCSNRGNGYSCACPTGFLGVDCSFDTQKEKERYTLKATGEVGGKLREATASLIAAAGGRVDDEKLATIICQSKFGPKATAPEAYSRQTLDEIWELSADKGKAVWLAGYVKDRKSHWTSGHPFPKYIPWVTWEGDGIHRINSADKDYNEKRCLGAWKNLFFTMNCSGTYNVVCAVPVSAT